MDAGSLVPDELIIKMMRERLSQQDAETGFILDGFPRTVEQAEALDELMEIMNIELDAVVLLDIEDDTVVGRLTARRVCSSCGAIYNVSGHPTKVEGVCDSCSGEVIQRGDDTESVIRHRLDVYHNQTAPLVDYYEKRKKIHRVDGAGPADSARFYLESLRV
jgi:adenylate kinase